MVIKNKELGALISLLDEPDNLIFGRIRQEIIMHGPDAIPMLEGAWDNSFNDLLQARISDIIHKIRLKRIQDKLISWKNTKNADLLAALILISSYQYPELDELSLRDKLENIRKDIWIEINENLTALEKIKVVNHILFEIHNFSGGKDNFNKPENYF
ncbi:MAG: transglutaminase-like domain-containing protein, partial [Bacteroidales bacterium]|nr:transglutaminase-like domain-containing protein [Bacteroidales bacterium]